MKRSLICLLAVIVLLQANGCGTGGKKQAENVNRMKIGISIYDQYDTFIAGVMDAFQEAAKQKERDSGVRVQVEIVNAAGSQMEQNNQVEDFISNGYNVICVNLVDRTDPSTIIEKAKSADIPVIFFNRELVEEDLERWDKLYYVGAVALESGTMQGSIVADAYRDHPEIDKNRDGTLQYVMLEGEAGHQDAIIRTENSVNEVINAGIPVEKIAYAIANWNRAQAQSRMTQWLESYGKEIEVVFANNDDMALGAIDALKEKEAREEWPVVVGIDGTQVGLEAVNNGEMLGTVYNDRAGQAKGMLELCFSLVTGNPLPETVELIDDKYIRLPHVRVYGGNEKEFLNR